MRMTAKEWDATWARAMALEHDHSPSVNIIKRHLQIELITGLKGTKNGAAQEKQLYAFIRAYRDILGDPRLFTRLDEEPICREDFNSEQAYNDYQKMVA